MVGRSRPSYLLAELAEDAVSGVGLSEWRLGAVNRAFKVVKWAFWNSPPNAYYVLSEGNCGTSTILFGYFIRHLV